jgi:hypothetical protein
MNSVLVPEDEGSGVSLDNSAPEKYKTGQSLAGSL